MNENMFVTVRLSEGGCYEVKMQNIQEKVADLEKCGDRQGRKGIHRMIIA